MSSLSTDSDANTRTWPSVRVTTDAVVAAYIHEISERHQTTPEPAQSPSAPRESA